MEIKVGDLVYGYNPTYYGIVYDILYAQARVFWYTGMKGEGYAQICDLETLKRCQQYAIDYQWPFYVANRRA